MAVPVHLISKHLNLSVCVKLQVFCLQFTGAWEKVLVTQFWGSAALKVSLESRDGTMRECELQYTSHLTYNKL